MYSVQGSGKKKGGEDEKETKSKRNNEVILKFSEPEVYKFFHASEDN